MKISLNWLKKHIDLPETTDQISELLTNCGLEVEDVYQAETIKGGLQGLLVGEVMEVSQHPNADRLRLTKVNIGADNYLNIVCGAPNVAQGQKVIVAPIGVTIYPLSGDPLTMKKAKIRGEESEGMICAEDEIGIGTSHDGILVLPSESKVGAPLTDYIETNSDFIFEIGLTPNRGDAASHLGVARDLRALLNRNLTLNSTEPVLQYQSGKNINVSITDIEKCGRYCGLLIDNIKVTESPDWLKAALKSIGLNPINNIVDITNYIMHDLGQPMHAFDADKLNGDIQVRTSKPDEKLVTLDKVERKLFGEELIIADNSGPLAIAGVIGGVSSSITDATTSIFLESAWFDAAIVRKSAKLHGISTDSSFRFERGIDPHNSKNALLKAAQLILEIAGGNAISQIVDVLPQPIEDPNFFFSFKKLKTVIGVEINTEELKTILKNLDIRILSETNEGFDIVVPKYRTDVTREIDVIEDILRIYGFNRIPFPTVMHSAAVVQPKPDKNSLKQIICNYLASQGFNEIMTNSLSRESYFSEEMVSKSIKLLNPLSNELSLMRPEILQSLLEAVAYNKNRKAHNLKFYEFGKVYFKSDSGYKEIEKLTLVVTGNKEEPNWLNKPQELDYFYLKTMVENTLSVVGVKKLKNITIAQVDSDLLKKFDIKDTVWYAEINVDQILTAKSKNVFKLEDIPVFPEVNRAINLIVDKTLNYSDIEQIVVKTTGQYLRKMRLADVFSGKPLEDGKISYTVNMVLYDSEKTMTDKQIDVIMQKLIATFENQLNAVIRK
jgi:phenylalanyl-tRNA synthetase beta chain